MNKLHCRSPPTSNLKLIKTRAKKRWLIWKNSEEIQMRKLGVSDKVIEELHTYDWNNFNSDRRFYQHLSDNEIDIRIFHLKKKLYHILFTWNVENNTP